ncbi:hypothetical protein PM082_007199 [Marasmius tenuissimus]|nr:hypothetical protein PM082_007199 [Marasmius tenuissimus]
MTKLFSVILAISLSIIILHSPVVRGLALESQQEISARSLDTAGGQLTSIHIVAIVLGAVASVSLAIAGCHRRAVEKEKAAKRLQAQQGQ